MGHMPSLATDEVEKARTRGISPRLWQGMQLAHLLRESALQ